MKNNIIGAILLLVFPFFSTNAQQVTKRDTIDGTPICLTMDRHIEDMMEKMEEKCSISKRAEGESHNSSSTSFTEPKYTSSSPKTTIKIAPNRALTNAEICRQNPRILGYKIQLTIVKSNDEANEVKAYFRRRFPSIKVETDASLRPNYKILAGSYFSKESASRDLSKIRDFFKSAIAIPYRVFCVEAK